MITTSTRITSDKIGLEYVREHSPNMMTYFDGKNFVIPNPCQRCGGSGRGSWYPDGGICYECRGEHTFGRKIIRSPKCQAQRIKAALRQAGKKEEKRKQQIQNQIEGQRDWCEANGHGRITFAELDQKRAAEREAARAVAEDCPEGKHAITGTVVKTECKETQWGNRFVMTVKDDRGFLVWGTIPTNLQLFDEEVSDSDEHWTRQRGLETGDRVTFTATIEPSRTDTKFGFFKRPKQSILLCSHPEKKSKKILD